MDFLDDIVGDINEKGNRKDSIMSQIPNIASQILSEVDLSEKMIQSIRDNISDESIISALEEGEIETLINKRCHDFTERLTQSCLKAILNKGH